MLITTLVLSLYTPVLKTGEERLLRCRGGIDYLAHRAFINVGEVVDSHVVFGVSNDQQAGEVAIEPNSGLPQVDVSGSPGVCEMTDRSSSSDAKHQLAELQLDHLVRFSLRGVRNAFEAGEQAEDNGLRLTLHSKSVETLVCTHRDEGEIEILDLTTSPATPIGIHDVRSRRIRDRLHQLVF